MFRTHKDKGDIYRGNIIQDEKDPKKEKICMKCDECHAKM